MSTLAGKAKTVRTPRPPARRTLSDRLDLWLGFTGPFGIEHRAEFYTDLAAFVEEGRAPMDVVVEMHEISSKRKSLKWRKLVTADLIRSSKEGYSSFGEQMARFGNSGEAAMLTTGEAAGQFAPTLVKLSTLIERQALISGAVRSTVWSLITYSAVALGMAIFLAKVLGPQFGEMVTPEVYAKLAIAPHFLSACNFVASYWIPLTILFVAGAWAMLWSLNTWKPSTVRNWLDDNVAPWSVFRRTKAAMFLATVATALNSGGQFKETVEQIEKNASGWERAHLKRILARLAGTGGIPAALSTGLLPIDVMDRLSMYLKSNNFAKVMQRLAIDTMDGLLKRARLIGKLVSVSMTLLIVAMLFATVLAGADIALNGMSPTGGAAF